MGSLFHEAIVRRYREAGDEAKAQELERKYGLRPEPAKASVVSDSHLSHADRLREQEARLREQDLEQARMFAERWSNILNSTHGAPKSRVWSPEGMMPRVYILQDQFWSFDRSGQRSSVTRGKVTMLDTALHRSQREALRKATSQYESWRSEYLESIWKLDEDSDMRKNSDFLTDEEREIVARLEELGDLDLAQQIRAAVLEERGR